MAQKCHEVECFSTQYIDFLSFAFHSLSFLRKAAAVALNSFQLLIQTFSLVKENKHFKLKFRFREVFHIFYFFSEVIDRLNNKGVTIHKSKLFGNTNR